MGQRLVRGGAQVVRGGAQVVRGGAASSAPCPVPSGPAQPTC